MRHFGILTLVFVVTSVGFAAEAVMDGDGVLRVDGERRFVTGMYEIPNDDAFAKELAGAGFNLVRCAASKESLDLAKTHGLGAWINTGNQVCVRDDAGADALRKFMEPIQDHPALWVWETPDEALWNIYYPRSGAVMKRWDELRDAVKKSDLSGDAKTELEEASRRLSTYRNSGRYAEAEAEERMIRERLGMDMNYGPMLSTWHDDAVILRDEMAAGCLAIRKADGAHPIWFNHAPRNTIADLRLFGELADIAGCDIYPVPLGKAVGHSDIADRNLSSVGAYTRRMAAGAPGKAVWMILQGFSWFDINDKFDPDIPRPTYDETRFMAYDAIANGARGVLYWGTAYIEKDSTLWNDIKRVVSELHELEPLLAAREPVWPVRLQMDFTPSSLEREVHCAARYKDGRCLLVLANETGSHQAFSISGLGAIEGKTFQVLDSWEKLTVENGSIRFGLPSQRCAALVTD